MASVGESQVVDKASFWYLSILETRLLRAVIVTWCCYNSYCPPCVRSQATSSSFSRTVPGARGAWDSQLSYWFTRCRLIWKILSTQIQQQICNKVLVKDPTIPKLRCYTTLWFIANYSTHVSGCCCFSDINILQQRLRDEKIMKIGQYLAKLGAKYSGTFSEHGVLLIKVSGHGDMKITCTIITAVVL